MYASGVMVIFGKMFRDIAERETRVITTFNDPKLGSESYAMVDVYCVDPACDCRRVMINVIRDRDTKHLATINWAFDPNDPDRGPFLDRLNTQSPLSDALLKLFKEEVITDKRYVERLERHYKLVKDAVADPHHEVHSVLKDVTRKSPETSKRFRAIYASASTDQELAEIWKEVGLDVPKELVDETIRRGEKMIPFLGDLLLDEELWDAGVEDKAGWAPAHALKLLSSIGGPKVIPFATEYFRLGLGGDWLTDEGDNFALSLGPKGIDPMFEVVEDEDADFWGRVIGVDGLAMLGLAHPAEVQEVLLVLLRPARKTVGRRKKPGTPGKTTIPADIVREATQRLVSTFRKWGYEVDHHLFVVPQQDFLYIEVKRKEFGSGEPGPPITQGSTTHMPLGRLKFLGSADKWEHQPYRYGDECWDARDTETGSPEDLMLSMVVQCLQ